MIDTDALDEAVSANPAMLALARRYMLPGAFYARWYGQVVSEYRRILAQRAPHGAQPASGRHGAGGAAPGCGAAVGAGKPE